MDNLSKAVEQHIYQILRVKWNQKFYYLLWLGLEEASMLTSKKGTIILFKKMRCVKKYAARKKIELNTEEIDRYDFDQIMESLEDEKGTLDSINLLNTWNLLDDISLNLGVSFEGSKKKKLTFKIYMKLFAGNNLPMIKPKEEEDYVPYWTQKERKRMKQIFRKGLHNLSSQMLVKKC